MDASKINMVGTCLSAMDNLDKLKELSESINALILDWESKNNAFITRLITLIGEVKSNVDVTQNLAKFLSASAATNQTVPALNNARNILPIVMLDRIPSNRLVSSSLESKQMTCNKVSKHMASTGVTLTKSSTMTSVSMARYATNASVPMVSANNIKQEIDILAPSTINLNSRMDAIRKGLQMTIQPKEPVQSIRKRKLNTPMVTRHQKRTRTDIDQNKQLAGSSVTAGMTKGNETVVAAKFTQFTAQKSAEPNDQGASESKPGSGHKPAKKAKKTNK